MPKIDKNFQDKNIDNVDYSKVKQIVDKCINIVESKNNIRKYINSIETDIVSHYENIKYNVEILGKMCNLLNSSNAFVQEYNLRGDEKENIKSASIADILNERLNNETAKYINSTYSNNDELCDVIANINNYIKMLKIVVNDFSSENNSLENMLTSIVKIIDQCKKNKSKNKCKSLKFDVAIDSDKIDNGHDSFYKEEYSSSESELEEDLEELEDNLDAIIS